MNGKRDQVGEEARVQWVSVVSRLILALAFGSAAFGKLASPTDFAASLESSGLSGAAVPVLGSALPALELCLAVALVLGWKERIFRWAAFVALCMFTLFLVMRQFQGVSATCACFGTSRFGNLISGPYTAFVRNAILLVLSVSWLRARTPTLLSLDRSFMTESYEKCKNP